MSWSAVLPGAALRVMRAAAGRRALHVGLLVAGLFVLGVLYGERARAAGEAPSVRDTVHEVTGVPLDQARGRARALAQGRSQDHDHAQGREAGAQKSRTVVENADVVLSGLRPLTEGVVRPVEERVLEPVGNAVEAVGHGLGAVVRAHVPPSEALPLPSVPPLPSAPSLPGPSELPGPADPPASPGLPDPPELTDLVGAVMPGAPAPEPPPSAPPPDAPDASGASEAADVRAPAEGAAGLMAAAHGPEHVAEGPSTAARVDTRRAPLAPAGQAPVRRAPAGDPDGTLGAGAGADQGTPRHGDAHAVTPHHPIPFRLVPGALVGADTAETRDRYRDIPVSPA